MAITETRTWADDLQDARERMKGARRALQDWEDHLDALAADPAPGRAFEVRRTARIATAEMCETTQLSQQAVAGYLGAVLPRT